MLLTATKDWLANNAGLAGCFASSGISYTDPDGIARTGSTGDVLNAFYVAHLLGKDSQAIKAGATYTSLKATNGGNDITLDDVSWAYANDGDPAPEPKYCAAAATPSPSPTPAPSPTPVPTPKPRTYPPAGGLLFDGKTSQVSVNSAGSLDLTNSITIEAWIKSDDGNSYYKRTSAKDTKLIGTIVTDMGRTVVKVVPADGDGIVNKYTVTLPKGYFTLADQLRVSDATPVANLITYTIVDTVTGVTLLNTTLKANQILTSSYTNKIFQLFYSEGNPLEVTASYIAASGVELYFDGTEITVRRSIIGKSGAYSLLLSGMDLRGMLRLSTQTINPTIPSMITGVWDNVLLTYDGANIKLYKNGVLLKTQAATEPITINTNKLVIGNSISDWGGKSYFKGTIAEVRVYNRALSQSEISANYSGTITRSGLVMEHVYTEGHARDLSGFGNDGTITGATFDLPTPTPAPTPSPSQGVIGALNFQTKPDIPQILFDLSNINMRQHPSDLHLEINVVKITNITPVTIYIATEVKLFKGATGSCPATGESFRGMDRTEANTRNVRIVVLSAGEVATLNMDFYQPGTISGLHTVCMFVHGTYTREELEAEIAPITG